MYNPTELFYKYEVQGTKDNKTIEMNIEQRDFNGNPDCKIGNFGYNFYYRTARAMQYKPYKNEASFRRAVILSLIKRGWTNVHFI